MPEFRACAGAQPDGTTAYRGTVNQENGMDGTFCKFLTLTFQGHTEQQHSNHKIVFPLLYTKRRKET